MPGQRNSRDFTGIIELLEQTRNGLSRFHEALVKGELIELFGKLEERLRELSMIVPEARPYYERVQLLHMYVRAIRVRALLHGVRSFMREASYIERHFMEVYSSVRKLLESLGASRPAL